MLQYSVRVTPSLKTIQVQEVIYCIINNMLVICPSVGGCSADLVHVVSENTTVRTVIISHQRKATTSSAWKTTSGSLLVGSLQTFL